MIKDLMKSKKVSLYLLRHAQSEFNASKQSKYENDCGLSKKGIDQSTIIQSWIKSSNFDLVYCSSALRCKQTVGNSFDEIVYSDDLKEIDYGNMNGLSISKIVFPIDYKPPNGESILDVQLRMNHAITNILNNINKIGSKLLIITHGRAIKYFLQTINIQLDEIPPNGTFIKIVFDFESNNLVSEFNTELTK